MGGMVLETNMSEILTHVEAQNKQEKSETTTSTLVRVRQLTVTKRKYIYLYYMRQNFGREI